VTHRPTTDDPPRPQCSDVAPSSQTHPSGEPYDRILAAVAALLDAGKASGEVRADVAPNRIFPLLSFLRHVAPQTETRTSHLLNLIVDALRNPRL
jgi:hypothetical protein